MTDKHYISELINKLMNNQLTEEEYNALIAIIGKAEKQEKIEEILGEYLEDKKNYGDLTFNRDDEDAEKLFSRIIQKVDKEEAVLNLETKRKRIWLGKIAINEFYKIAAVLILVVGIFYFFKDDMFFSHEAPIAAPTNSEAGDITLQLADGEVVVISENGEKEILGEKGSLVAEQNGSRLSYTSKNKSSEVFYNELFIPYGKKFDLVLADGTQVTLNAGSWIKYPVQFSQDGSRKVFFKGEAYFDVAEDKVRPFLVNTGAIGVEVLGTEFNVSNYPEDKEINTVLVEGSVKINLENKKEGTNSSRLLKPGDKASWSNDNDKMVIEKVDVSKYTSWKEGIMKFDNIPFRDIRKKLERHFDVEIVNYNQLLDKQVYTATFKEESIEEVLNAFKEDTPFEYKLGYKRIIIKSD